MNTQSFIAKSFSRRHVVYVPATLAAEAASENARLVIKTNLKAGSKYALAYP